MATWSVRTTEGVRDNVTIYQVQEMLRTGQLRADTEVSEGERWVLLAEVPALAKFVPAANSAPTTDEVLSAHGLVLQRDVNGKPILPPPDVIARMLETDAARDRTNTERGRKLAVGAGLVVAWFFAIVTLYYLVVRPHPALLPPANAPAPGTGVQAVQTTSAPSLRARHEVPDDSRRSPAPPPTIPPRR